MGFGRTKENIRRHGNLPRGQQFAGSGSGFRRAIGGADDLRRFRRRRPRRADPRCLLPAQECPPAGYTAEKPAPADRAQRRRDGRDRSHHGHRHWHQPEWVGANLVLSGVPSLSSCPLVRGCSSPMAGPSSLIWKTHPANSLQRSSRATTRARACPTRLQPRASAVSPPLSSAKVRSAWATMLRSISRRKKSTRPFGLPYNATNGLALIRIFAAGKLSVPCIQFSDEEYPLNHKFLTGTKTDFGIDRPVACPRLNRGRASLVVRCVR